MNDDKYRTIQIDTPVFERFVAICNDHAPHTRKIVFDALVRIAEGMSVPKVREMVNKAYDAKEKKR